MRNRCANRSSSVQNRTPDSAGLRRTHPPGILKAGRSPTKMTEHNRTLTGHDRTPDFFVGHFCRTSPDTNRTSSDPPGTTGHHRMPDGRPTVSDGRFLFPTVKRLWGHAWAKENLLHQRNLDYCAYGFLLKKNTTLAFSDEQYCAMFKPLTCRGVGKCPSMTVSPVTVNNASTGGGGRVQEGHCTWDYIKGAKVRSVIPEQLCYNVLAVAKARATEIAQHLVREE